MSEEKRLKLENELLLTKSKAQMINLYLDLLQENKRYKELGFKYLNEQNNQLKDRINKAVDYINWWVEDNKKQEIGLTISETDGLLSLLKGDKE